MRRASRGLPHRRNRCEASDASDYSVHVSTDATPEPTEAAPDALDLSTPAPTGEPTPTPTRAARRAVVAEDEALIRMDVVETLREAGFDVVGEAGDGETAVQLAMDLQARRRRHGREDARCSTASRRPSASARRTLAPVVLLTAFSQTELVERARDAGAMAYVVKPFSPADLLPAVEIAISRYSQISALESEVADLAERFETRKRVDRAKGLLMTKMGLSEPESFRWIQKTSMDRRLTMREVADAVIEQVGGASS